MKDAEFEQARKALQSKQKDLKQKGKGYKPNASVALTEEEIKILYDKGLLGTSTPEALLEYSLVQPAPSLKNTKWH